MPVLLVESIVGVIKRFKAPKNTMYFVTGVSFANFSAIVANLSVVTYLIEDELTTFKTSAWKDSLANFPTTIAGQVLSISNIDQKTKYLSIVKDSAAGISCIVTIYGTIIPASKVDLLWEWFRKGR